MGFDVINYLETETKKPNWVYTAFDVLIEDCEIKSFYEEYIEFVEIFGKHEKPAKKIVNSNLNVIFGHIPFYDENVKRWRKLLDIEKESI